MEGHRRFYLGLGLIAIAVMLVQVSAYYYFQRQYDVGSLTSAITVNTLVNYGNSTVRWYNKTNISAGWNFYQLTVYVANGNVEAQFYGPPLNEHFVTGINGVRNSGHSYWTLWVYCERETAWTVSKVGADLISLSNGETLAWAYQVLSSPNPTQPPVSGARTLSSCS